MDAKTFFSTYQSAAQSASQKTGVPALLILAQAALESGYGAHAPQNAFFGIKADKSWKGKTQMLSTHEYVKGVWVAIPDSFRAYDSAQESFEDWANFLLKNPRYKPVLVASDTVTAAQALQSAGYSTSPTYADSLIVVAHKLSSDLIPATQYAESLARVLGSTAKKDATKIVNAASSPAGIAAISLAGIASLIYFLGRHSNLGG
jgi:flagellum-specific peptidoglycan hydrolase FlgJ